MRAVLYARISVSREESVSVERQLEAGRAECERRGWTVVSECVDEGVSATRNRPEDRAEWLRLLQLPEPFDVVVIWKVDRLARRTLDFLNASKALQARNAELVAVEDDVDMTTATGRAFATILSVFAEMEADSVSARVRAAKRQLTMAGRVSGGAAPYGYMNAPNPDGAGKVLARDPSRISFVIEAADKVLGGASVHSVTKWLNECGAPVKQRKNDGGWSITVVKRLLENPTLAGMTPYNPGNTGKSRGPDVLRGSDGLPIIREDLAILTPSQHRELLARLADRSRPRATDGKSDPLLSGLVWCARCGGKVYRNRKTIKGESVSFHRCDECGTSARRLTAHVVSALLERHGHERGLRTEELSSGPDPEKLIEIAAAIDETTELMKHDGADMPTLFSRIEALKADRQRLRDQGVDRQFKVTPHRFRDLWVLAQDSPETQRKLLVSKVERIWLSPADRGGRIFEPSRIQFDLRAPTRRPSATAWIESSI